jgi:predicted enzyme related to lactoylglutathione lyase
MKRVTGIGGIFFKSENPAQLYDWYEKYLGIQRESYGQGASFHWREPQAADGTEPGPKASTAWCIFPQATRYFAASKASFMVNYRVDNLDALLEDLKKSEIEIDPHREDYDYGRFAWITDPDGNRIELWEPPKPKEDRPWGRRPPTFRARETKFQGIEAKGDLNL